MSGIPHSDLCLCRNCNARAIRIAAFGAIRRAAQVARYCDGQANGPSRVDPVGSPREEQLRQYPAIAVRAAIRAAIGSDKA